MRTPILAFRPSGNSRSDIALVQRYRTARSARAFHSAAAWRDRVAGQNAYELYNWRRALGLTLLLGVVGLAIIYVGVAIASVLRCLPKKDSGENSDSDSGHTSPVGPLGFYANTPEGAGSGPDGNILSLATCPQCGQPLSEIGAACPSCIAKATGLAGP